MRQDILRNQLFSLEESFLLAGKSSPAQCEPTNY